MKNLVIFFVLIGNLFLTINAQQTSDPASSQTAPESLFQTPTLTTLEGLDVPDKAIELNTIGVEKSLKKKYADAIPDFQKAIALAPDCYPCSYNLARALIETGKSQMAIEILEEVVNKKPDYGLAFAGLGEALYENKQFEKSVTAFQKSLKLLPDDVPTLCNLGNALQQIGRYAESLKVFEQAVSIEPRYALAHNNRGVSLFSMGRMKEAVKSFQKALALDSKIPEAHNNLGVALDVLEKHDEAGKHFEAALQLRPGWDYATYNLALNHISRGDRTAAYTQLNSLEKTDSSLAENLKKQLWGNFVINAFQEVKRKM